MRVLVYKRESDEFICPKCGEKIMLNTEKLEEIIKSNNNIQDIINGIKFNIENALKISTINLINIQLKNINLLLNNINEDIKKNNEKLKILLKDNNSISKTNIINKNNKTNKNPEIPKVKEISSKKNELNDFNNINNNSLSSENKKKDKVNKSEINYIGSKNSQGKKQGFGILVYSSGEKHKGTFIDDKASGWGIHEEKNGLIFRGEYKEGITRGYGEFSRKNVFYYGYWYDNM